MLLATWLDSVMQCLDKSVAVFFSLGDFCHFLSMYRFLIGSGYEPFVGYTYGQYLPPLSGLSFHSLNGVI